MSRYIFIIWFCGVSLTASAQSNCSRLISLAPSITEVVSELGLSKNLIGVSRYDKASEPLKGLPRVGGLMDLNLEVIASLRPTLVLGLDEQSPDLAKLQELDLETLTLNHKSISGIIESIRSIGASCELQAAASTLSKSLEAQLADYKERGARLPKQRALVLIGDSGAKRLRDLFISGNDGYFSGALQILGATNIYGKRTGGLATVSLETIMSLNPAVIFIVASNVEGLEIDKAGIVADLAEFPEIDAVKTKRIYFLEKDYAYTPGPRFPLLLAELLADLRKGAVS